MTSEKKVKIKLNEVIENYNKILTSTSRGFDTQHEFLEAWVPSEDKVSCVLDLISAAEDYSIQKFIIEMDDKLINELKVNEEFKLKISKLYNYNFDGVNLSINFKND